jgi:hypothetical protein
VKAKSAKSVAKASSESATKAETDAKPLVEANSQREIQNATDTDES